MSAREPELELVVRDIFSDDGFIPGLRPRLHLDVLGEGLAAYPAEHDAVADGEDADEQKLEALLDGLMRRQQEGESHARSDEEPQATGEGSPGDPEPSSQKPQAEEPPPAADRHHRADGALERARQGRGLRDRLESVDPHPLALRDSQTTRHPEALEAPEPARLTPEVRHNLERLEHARRGVESFEAGNVHQTELRRLLILILDHMTFEHCKPGEGPDFERWWAVVRTYRRILATPEMASRGARSVLNNLLELEPDKLTQRHLEYALGRRKPQTPKKSKKRRPWRRR